MKIKYLGTSAFEGIPAPFCDCNICRNARLKGGKEIRSRQQAIINDEVLLDFGPDTISHTQKYLLDWTKIHNILITHTHSDHFYLDDYRILVNFHSKQENKRINTYGGESLVTMINERFSHPKAKEELHSIGNLTLVHEGEILEFDGYRVLPIEANHPIKTSPYIYLIEKDNKRILYAHDTGMLKEEQYELIRKFGHIDLISIDCNGALSDQIWVDNHLSFSTCLDFFNKLNGVIDEKTIKVLSHISHLSNTTHEDFENVAKANGCVVAFDGLEIEL